ncbi:EthD family reductase [Polaromonas sp.]|uniref:EthD family reductase n=1 Tax=Polaromonas sp. TaxID=1869339 RepID=UPI0017C6F895|nr:EthD family reductase [Polaromonas sp.]NMM07793.1 EthD family reductase [Polaromonas sp.]
MAKLVALYKKPQDTAAFDRHYSSIHLPLARKIPNLLSYEISTGAVASAAGDSPYHLVAILEFESLESIQQALGSPEGQATAADLSNFAQAGVEMLMFDSKEV